MAGERKHPFLQALCEQLFGIQIIFLISTTFLVLSLVSVVVVEPGTGAYVISIVNVVTLGLFAGVSGLLIRNCRP